MVEIFIRNVCIDADMVFVLGDLFEFYHGYEGYIYPWYRPIVDAFKTITEQGKSVYFLEGNHEFDMGPFFESYTGIQCVKNLTIDIEGKRTFISHGDEFYLNLVTRALKAPLTIGAMNLFGPRLSWKIAMAVSRIMSKKRKGRTRKLKMCSVNMPGKSLKKVTTQSSLLTLTLQIIWSLVLGWQKRYT